MGFVYSEFDSTPNTLIADIKAKILLSSDYSNPTAQVVMATTPLGGKIVMDVAGAAAVNTQYWSPNFWRNWVSGAGVDSVVGRNLWFKNLAGVMTQPLHCRVSAGPTLLWVDVEGPRGAEPSPDHVPTGSWRQTLAVAEVTPYHAADLVPTVLLAGSSAYPGYNTNVSNQVSGFSHISRNTANTQSWAYATLNALAYPGFHASGWSYNYQPLAMDGKTYLSPYVVFEVFGGIRGRLTDLFYGGIPFNSQANGYELVTQGLQQNDFVTYGGNTYKMLLPYRSSQQTNSTNSGSFGAVGSSAGLYQSSPLVAVRVA